jgi:uncharacterized membrane protein
MMSSDTPTQTGQVFIGAKVDCTDGTYGVLDAVVVNPLTRTVTHYAVRDERDKKVDRLVPAGHCTAASPTVLRLDCTIDEVNRMPAFTESEYVLPVGPPSGPGWSGMYFLPYVAPFDTPASGGYRTVEVENVPPATLALKRGINIDATDGFVGKLGQLVIDVPSGRITHFVLEMRKGTQMHELTLPVSAVDYVLADTAYLKLDRQSVEMLPAIPVRRPILDFAGFERAELVAKIFDGPSGASEALHFLEEVQRDNRFTLKIREAAVLVRDENGVVSIRETAEVSPARGGVVGGLIGGAVGLTGGPLGILLGALVGAGAGRTIGPRLDLGFSDAFLDRLKDRLAAGRSGLILLIEHDWETSAPDALRAIDGVIPQQRIIDTVVQDLLTARE